MTHQQIQELLGAYSLDAVDPAERVEVAKHLPDCSECRREVDSFRHVASHLGGIEELPPPAVWERLQSTVDQTAVVDLASRSRVTWWKPLISVAAMVALLVGFGIQSARLTEVRGRLAQAEARSADLEASIASGQWEAVARLAAATPGAQTVSLDGSLGRGTIVILPDGTGFLLDNDLDPLDRSRTYQLWAVQDGTVISAGVLGASPGVVTFHVDPQLLEGLVITAERAGGVVTSEQTEASAWFPEA
jgi:hypothetical protein